MTATWVNTPVGLHADRWATVARTHKILFVTHTMASANRLVDLLDLFDSDARVQIVHTCPDTAGIPSGVAEHFVDNGFAVVSWQQAVHTNWDLVLTANTSGGLHELPGPILVVSHGIGYTKTISSKTRKPENPKTGLRAFRGIAHLRRAHHSRHPCPVARGTARPPRRGTAGRG
ncbi:hypothetical protein [Actinophytocola sediminis]